FGEREQGWIELDEGRIDRGVIGVAGITVGGTRNHFGGFSVAETKESPLPGKTRFVFHVDFKAHRIAALKMASLVDGPPAFGATALEDEHGFVWPRAGLEENLVGLAIDEDIVKHVVVHIHRRVVAHVETGGEVDPFAIVLGETELTIAGVFRAGTRRGIQTDSCSGEERRSAEERDFQFGNHDGEYAAGKGGRPDRWLQKGGNWLHFGARPAGARYDARHGARANRTTGAAMVLDWSGLAGHSVVGRDANGSGDAFGTHASPLDVFVCDGGAVVVAVGARDAAGAAIGALAACAMEEDDAVAGARGGMCVHRAGVCGVGGRNGTAVGSLGERDSAGAVWGSLAEEVLQPTARVGDFVWLHFAGGVPAGIERKNRATADG